MLRYCLGKVPVQPRIHSVMFFPKVAANLLPWPFPTERVCATLLGDQSTGKRATSPARRQGWKSSEVVALHARLQHLSKFAGMVLAFLGCDAFKYQFDRPPLRIAWTNLQSIVCQHSKQSNLLGDLFLHQAGMFPAFLFRGLKQEGRKEATKEGRKKERDEGRKEERKEGRKETKKGRKIGRSEEERKIRRGKEETKIRRRMEDKKREGRNEEGKEDRKKGRKGSKEGSKQNAK